jgi:glucan phosphoethanolaminetransferase (alkaline phosphatase superfamily)
MNDEINQSDAFPEDAQEHPKKRRTIWMWLILTWAAYSFVTMAIAVVTYLLGVMPEATGLKELGVEYYLMLLVYSSILLAASLALFFFRVVAIKLFFIAAVGGSFISFYPMTNPEYMAFQQNTANMLNISPWTIFLGGWIWALIIYIAVILYSLRLKRWGWLID